MSTKEKNPILIRKNIKIGELDAETDIDLLKSCFVDKGDVSILMDVAKPASIILGRTGSGKSALLLHIAEKAEKSRTLDPNEISIRFLEHSDIIQFFNEIGVKLDLFYRLLWRHILTIELLKIRYDLKNKVESETLFSRLFKLSGKDHIKKEALSYFTEWGDKFWLDTNEQLKQVTEKLTRDIRANFGAEVGNIDMSLRGARSLSSEMKSEVVSRASRVVSEIQIKKLSDVLDLLEENVFDDDQKKYYLLIDKLDEDWATTETRCKFIRALVEEIKAFRRIKNVKIIVAMRKDLMELVFDKTRDGGFQQEKYESYLFPVTWKKEEIRALVERRIGEVFRRQYTRTGISFDDIFAAPRKGGGQSVVDYILERTFLRPRDAMQFVNECLVGAVNLNRVSWKIIYAAESTYSQKRLKSLFEEWSEIFPALEKTIELLRGLPENFPRTSLSGERLHAVECQLMEHPEDPCAQAVIKFCEPGGKAISEGEVVAELVSCFYRIGAVGVKISGPDTFLWSDYDRATLSKGEIKRVNQIKIHKMLYRALGVRVHGHQYQSEAD